MLDRLTNETTLLSRDCVLRVPGVTCYRQVNTIYLPISSSLNENFIVSLSSPHPLGMVKIP